MEFFGIIWSTAIKVAFSTCVSFILSFNGASNGIPNDATVHKINTINWNWEHVLEYINLKVEEVFENQDNKLIIDDNISAHQIIDCKENDLCVNKNYLYKLHEWAEYKYEIKVMNKYESQIWETIIWWFIHSECKCSEWVACTDNNDCQSKMCDTTNVFRSKIWFCVFEWVDKSNCDSIWSYLKPYCIIETNEKNNCGAIGDKIKWKFIDYQYSINYKTCSCPCVDFDGDGFCEDVDCDDNSYLINPKSQEICNDWIDNNCNWKKDCGDVSCVLKDESCVSCEWYIWTNSCEEIEDQKKCWYHFDLNSKKICYRNYSTKEWECKPSKTCNQKYIISTSSENWCYIKWGENIWVLDWKTYYVIKNWWYFWISFWNNPWYYAWNINVNGFGFYSPGGQYNLNNINSNHDILLSCNKIENTCTWEWLTKKIKEYEDWKWNIEYTTQSCSDVALSDCGNYYEIKNWNYKQCWIWSINTKEVFEEIINWFIEINTKYAEWNSQKRIWLNEILWARKVFAAEKEENIYSVIMIIWDYSKSFIDELNQLLSEYAKWMWLNDNIYRLITSNIIPTNDANAAKLKEEIVSKIDYPQWSKIAIVWLISPEAMEHIDIMEWYNVFGNRETIWMKVLNYPSWTQNCIAINNCIPFWHTPFLGINESIIFDWWNHLRIKNIAKSDNVRFESIFIHPTDPLIDQRNKNTKSEMEATTQKREISKINRIITRIITKLGKVLNKWVWSKVYASTKWSEQTYTENSCTIQLWNNSINKKECLHFQADIYKLMIKDIQGNLIISQDGKTEKIIHVWEIFKINLSKENREKLDTEKEYTAQIQLWNSNLKIFTELSNPWKFKIVEDDVFCETQDDYIQYKREDQKELNTVWEKIIKKREIDWDFLNIIDNGWVRKLELIETTENEIKSSILKVSSDFLWDKWDIEIYTTEDNNQNDMLIRIDNWKKDVSFWNLNKQNLSLTQIWSNIDNLVDIKMYQNIIVLKHIVSDREVFSRITIKDWNLFNIKNIIDNSLYLQKEFDKINENGWTKNMYINNNILYVLSNNSNFYILDLNNESLLNSMWTSCQNEIKFFKNDEELHMYCNWWDTIYLYKKNQNSLDKMHGISINHWEKISVSFVENNKETIIFVSQHDSMWNTNIQPYKYNNDNNIKEIWDKKTLINVVYNTIIYKNLNDIIITTRENQKNTFKYATLNKEKSSTPTNDKISITTSKITRNPGEIYTYLHDGIKLNQNTSISSVWGYFEHENNRISKNQYLLENDRLNLLINSDAMKIYANCGEPVEVKIEKKSYINIQDINAKKMRIIWGDWVTAILNKDKYEAIYFIDWNKSIWGMTDKEIEKIYYDELLFKNNYLNFNENSKWFLSLNNERLINILNNLYPELNEKNNTMINSALDWNNNPWIWANWKILSNTMFIKWNDKWDILSFLIEEWTEMETKPNQDWNNCDNIDVLINYPRDITNQLWTQIWSKLNKDIVNIVSIWDNSWCHSTKLDKDATIKIKLNNYGKSELPKIYVSADHKTFQELSEDKIIERTISDSNLTISFKTDHFSLFVLWNTINNNTNNNQTNTWWWSRLVKDNCCMNGNLIWKNYECIDYSPSYYDNRCDEKTHWTTSHQNIDEICGSNEVQIAYTFGNSIWMVNKKCELDRANKAITRWETAKMISIFAKKMLNKTPEDIIWCNNFKDLENTDLKEYMLDACNLRLMWREPDWIKTMEKFNPDEELNRAMFGTLLSRLIYGWSYNAPFSDYIIKWEKFRFDRHLKALNDNGIMKHIENPYMPELRSRVILMLYRYMDSIYN